MFLNLNFSGMNISSHSKIRVQALKDGWIKRTYQFIANEEVLGELHNKKSYCKEMKAHIGEKEFVIRRGGLWKRFIEVKSSFEAYNVRIDINWRNKIKVTDSAGHTYVFKPTGIWHSRWQWLDRHERILIEIKSKTFSRKNRGSIEIKEAEMKDPLFWIIVSWFVILCSESDMAIVAAT